MTQKWGRPRVLRWIPSLTVKNPSTSTIDVFSNMALNLPTETSVETSVLLMYQFPVWQHVTIVHIIWYSEWLKSIPRCLTNHPQKRLINSAHPCTHYTWWETWADVKLQTNAPFWLSQVTCVELKPSTVGKMLLMDRRLWGGSGSGVEWPLGNRNAPSYIP